MADRVGHPPLNFEQGFVDTDFAGRSFDFTNDESLTEYQPLVGAFLAA